MEDYGNRRDEKSLARRRLMRGIFSAPVALTLYSGSAIAASSNLRALQRLAEGDQPATFSQNPTSPTDTWIRVQVYRASFADGLEIKTAEVVRGSDIALFSPGGGAFLSNTQYAKVEDSTIVESVISDPVPINNKYVVVRFDPESGNIIAVSGTDGTAATCSSLNSFSGVTCFN